MAAAVDLNPDLSKSLTAITSIDHADITTDPDIRTSISDHSDQASIPEFYAGKTVFITGATGFVGKVLLEKLLRSCPKIKAIYCLVRPKRGQSAQERVAEMLNCKLYSKLLEKQPDFTSKVHAIHGDIMCDELGIHEDKRKFLQDSIDIIFHSAATVKFDEPLRYAMDMNVLGVRKMIKLAKEMKNLEAFVHVSTAYAHCQRSHIEEVVYPPPLDLNKLLETMEWMSDEIVDLITPKLLGDSPNTYTFTKCLAENLLITEGHGLPYAIVRPAIVTATWKEPFPGWIDSANGPSGLYIAAGKGFMRSFKCRTDYVADLVPVDLPVNLLVAVGWHTSVFKPPKPLVFQCTIGEYNPFTWGELEGVLNKYFKCVPFEDCIRRPNISLRSNSLVHDYWILVSHLIPAYIMDVGYALVGSKPRMVNTYNKLHRVMATLQYFTLHSWTWPRNNIDMLQSIMSELDQKSFYLDARSLHWQTYIENSVLGSKLYVCKEDPAGLPAARAHLKKLRNIRYCFNTAILVILWRLLIANHSLARNSWFFIMGLVAKFVRFFHISSTITQ